MSSAAWVVAGWSGVAIVLLLADAWMFEKIWVLGAFIQLGWGIIGVVVLVVLLFFRRWKPALVLLLAGAALPFAPLPAWGGAIWFRISFEQQRSTYEQIVNQASALAPQGEVQGIPYRIEPGPPLRIAFPQPVGVADNWGAVVHDPSDAVLRARGWGKTPGRFTAPENLRELWGGDLLSCTRITGHYHRCWFT